MSMEKLPLNPFEIKPTVAQLRADYQTMLTGDRIKKQAAASSFMDDPRIARGFREREQERTVQAARLIIGQVGKANLEDLRAAVEPEKLKDVLLRGGAGVDVLMMAGEKEAAGFVIEERQKRMQEVINLIDEFKATPVHPVLLKIWQKVVDAEAKLLPLESKDIWSSLDAGHYFAFNKKFEEEIDSMKATCERFKEMAA